MEKENNAPEVSENTSNDNSQSVAPTDQNQEAEKITEDLDPRVVEIVGEDNIKEAFSEKEDTKNDESETEDKKSDELDRKENQENEADKGNENDFVRNQIQSTYKPTRLDRRLANRFVRVLHLQGDENIPSEDEIINDLQNYTKDDKINALKHYLGLEKQLRGQEPDDVLEDGDNEAIIDAEREEIRREVIAEENNRREAKSFVEFMDQHPELDETKKEYDPALADAVETLFKGGMPINKAHETIMSKIEQVKKEKVFQEKAEKNRALSGIISGTGESTSNSGEMTWDDVERISTEDPQKYQRMLAEGKFKHLIN